MPEFPTITHVALTVSDLERSVPWYEELFGAKPVLDEPFAIRTTSPSSSSPHPPSW